MDKKQAFVPLSLRRCRAIPHRLPLLVVFLMVPALPLDDATSTMVFIMLERLNSACAQGSSGSSRRTGVWVWLSANRQRIVNGHDVLPISPGNKERQHVVKSRTERGRNVLSVSNLNPQGASQKLSC